MLPFLIATCIYAQWAFYKPTGPNYVTPVWSFTGARVGSSGLKEMCGSPLSKALKNKKVAGIFIEKMCDKFACGLHTNLSFCY